MLVCLDILDLYWSYFLLARLMGQYCFAHCRRRRSSSSVTLPADGPGAWAVGWPTLQGGQYGYVPLGRHLVICCAFVANNRK